ncbi:hypothetical protein LINGRAHAP2_LOCUS15643 [Linum grandiflorum]
MRRSTREQSTTSF